MNAEDVKEFRLGELFCGPGGLALAAITAKIDDPEYRIVHKWANDYDLWGILMRWHLDFHAMIFRL